jgi:precorrin-6A synthase
VIHVVGFGMGPQHVTPEAAAALRSCDYVLAAAKRDDDPLLAIRRAVCAEYGVELVAVPDPERDRVSTGSTTDGVGYDRAVRDWHAARVAAYRAVIEARPGAVGFLVWGDPALYDSTIRVVEQLDEDFDVIPGISAPQLLAARHRIVLHEVGRPVHVTTARRLSEAVAAGQRTIVVMLGAEPALDGLAGWRIWYGANLGAPGEQLLTGRVGEVDLIGARARARARDGWVMDVSMLRAP